MRKMKRTESSMNNTTSIRDATLNTKFDRTPNMRTTTLILSPFAYFVANMREAPTPTEKSAGMRSFIGNADGKVSSEKKAGLKERGLIRYNDSKGSFGENS